VSNRRKIKKYLLNNPRELESLKNEVRGFSKHINKIIEDKDIPSFNDFLEQNEDIAPYFNKFRHTSKVHSNFITKPWYMRLKLIIPASMATLLCLLMIFMPIGQAFADRLYKTFVQWFDDGVSIHHGISNAPSDNQELSIEYYDNLEDVQSELNIGVAQNKHATLNEQIKLKQNDFLIEIKSVYIVSTRQVVVTQTIFEGDTEWSSSIQFNGAQSFDETLDNNIRFIGYVQDGNGYAIAYIDNMKIEIYSERLENVDYQEFVNFVKGMDILYS
jgi:hypothetical protein